MLTQYGSWDAIAFPTVTPEITTYEGIDGMADFTIESSLLTFSNPWPEQSGPYGLAGIESGWWTVYAGENDFRLNLGQPQSVSLDISSTRWEHELVVRHSEGTTSGRKLTGSRDGNLSSMDHLHIGSLVATFPIR